MKFILLSLLALPVLAGDPPGAEYYPLVDGSRWSYAYSSVMTLTDPAMAAMNFSTSAVYEVRVDGRETINGKEYVRTLTDMGGLFGLTTTTNYYRLAEDGIYSAGDIRGTFSESRLVAFPIADGAAWEYFDGVAGQRRIAAVTNLDVGGKTYERCLKIVRDFKDPEKQRQISIDDWYAPGVGPVLFVFRQDTGMSVSETRNSLSSYRKGP